MHPLTSAQGNTSPSCEGDYASTNVKLSVWDKVGVRGMSQLLFTVSNNSGYKLKVLQLVSKFFILCLE